MPVTDYLFIILDTVDNTNNYAMAKVHAGLANHGKAYFCGLQTAGKGQRGKIWQTSEGVNIALSIVLDVYTFNASQQFQLSIAVALGCYDFFKKYAGDETSIKWPNDIYWRDRKAGGILIENVFHGNEWRFAVAGIGININQPYFDAALQNPVSLKQITGKVFDSVELAKELHQSVLRRFEKLETEGIDKLLTEYNQLLFSIDKKVKLKKDSIIFDATIKGVTEHGELITFDGIERRFIFGDVSWIL